MGMIPIEITGCLNQCNPSSHNMALELAQPLIEMNTRDLPGSKGQPVRKVDNLTIIYKLTV